MLAGVVAVSEHAAAVEDADQIAEASAGDEVAIGGEAEAVRIAMRQNTEGFGLAETVRCALVGPDVLRDTFCDRRDSDSGAVPGSR